MTKKINNNPYDYLAIAFEKMVATPNGAGCTLLFVRSCDFGEVDPDSMFVQVADMVVKVDNIMSVSQCTKNFKFDYEKHPNPYKESPVTLEVVS
jgi:hypothetical protein